MASRSSTPSGGSSDLEKPPITEQSTHLAQDMFEKETNIDTKVDKADCIAASPIHESRDVERGPHPKRPMDAVEEDDEDHDDDEDGEPSVMDRVLSRMTSRSSYDPGPPPDGGWQAWNQFITCSWGFINSFGSFQPYYTETLNRSRSDISWIGSISTFLLFFVGTFTGRLTDAGYFRFIFLLGSILLVGGAIATSFCTTYWQLILAQGLCMGLGNGGIFCPSVAVLSTYFHKKKALVIGIAACGSATGGLVFPSIVRQLLPKIGFGWTVRVMALIMLVCLVVANLIAKPRVKPRRTGPIVDWAAFREMEYTFYASGTFFCFWAIYFAFYYLAAFSTEVLNPPFSYSESLDLLLILNGVGVFGRLIPNYIADRVGAINVFIPTAFAGSIVILCWTAVSTSTGLYVWCIFYGICAAGMQSLFPAALAFLTTDLKKVGVRMGMVFTIVSFAVLTGTPIAGAIIAAADGDGSDVRRGYQAAQGFAGASMMVGGGLLLCAKIVRMRKTGQGWTGRI